MENYNFSEEEIENFHKKIGKKVKELREKKSFTQMQLSLAMGHNSVGHVAKAELNKYGKHFSLEQLYKISKILDIEISEFFS